MLISNGSRYQCNPMRLMFGVGVLNDTRINRVMAGSLYNQATSFGKLASTPQGYYPGSAWIFPRTAGSLSSHNLTELRVSTLASGAMGLAKSGTSVLTITSDGTGFRSIYGVGNATTSLQAIGSILGQVLVFGSTTMTITTNGLSEGIGTVAGTTVVSLDTIASVAAVFNTSGTTSLSISVTGSIEALGVMLSSCGITISTIAEIIGGLVASGTTSVSISTSTVADGLGINTGQASFQLASSMISYAVGHMVGSTLETSDILTIDGITNAVWNAMQTNYTIPGTMGSLLGTGGSALTTAEHNKLMAIVSDVTQSPIEGTITLQQAIEVLLAVIAGKTSGGSGNTLTFRDTEDTVDRVVATVDNDGNRLNIEINV